MKYKTEFKEAHPETIGEKDSAFDMSNYIDWIDVRVESLITELARTKANEKFWFDKMNDLHPDKCKELLEEQPF